MRRSPEAGLTRRQVLVSGALAAGYALAVQPVRADPIATDEAGLIAGWVRVPVGDGEIAAYRAQPASGGAPLASGAPLPVVLVVHEIFGVHAYICDVVRRLAKAGFLAIAPDLFQRHGDVTKLESVEQILSSVVVKVNDAQVMSDLDATLAWVAKDGQGDAARAAVTGFCWGGRIVWLYAAHNPKLRAGAAWYGRLVGEAREPTPKHPIDVAGGLHAPVLGLYGSDDPGIPQSSVLAMRAKLAGSQPTSEIVVFPAAPHGFHADYRDSYRPLAAQEAWRRMLAWFREHGVGQSAPAALPAAP